MMKGKGVRGQDSGVREKMEERKGKEEGEKKTV
jgi:hypothetical protein